jgi:predicted nucleic acid-binding protein
MAKALLLDSNLLVLFIVGSAGENLIGRHNCLDAFDVDDYRQITSMIAGASRLILVAHVLVETSNLIRQISEPAKSEVTAILKLLIDRFPEEAVSSADATIHTQYLRLGLTDAVLLTLSITPNAVLFTADHDLYGAATGEGREAYNFFHFKASGFAPY